MTSPAPFPHLFTPLTLRHVTLRNRIVFGAHTANMAEDGLPGRRHLGYYVERARGGAAMIVVEPVPVHATAVLTRGNFRPGDDAVIDGFRAITDACHAEGAVMVQQLYHVGQHGDFDNSFRPSWSPSGLPSFHDAEGSHAMTDAEIEEVIAGYVDAAVASPTRRASTASRSSPRTTPWSTSSGCRGRTAATTGGVPASRTGCDSRRRSSAGSGTRSGTVRDRSGRQLRSGDRRRARPATSCATSSPGTTSGASWTTSRAAPAATSTSPRSSRPISPTTLRVSRRRGH